MCPAMQKNVKSAHSGFYATDAAAAVGAEEWIRLGRERLNGHLEELAGKIRLFDEKYLGRTDT